MLKNTKWMQRTLYLYTWEYTCGLETPCLSQRGKPNYVKSVPCGGSWAAARAAGGSASKAPLSEQTPCRWPQHLLSHHRVCVCVCVGVGRWLDSRPHHTYVLRMCPHRTYTLHACIPTAHTHTVRVSSSQIRTPHGWLAAGLQKLGL